MAVPSKRKQLWIWTSAAVLAIAGLVVVLIRGHHPAGVRRAVLISGSPEKGAALFYGDKQCGICHAVNGKGGRLAPDLAGLQPSPPALGWLTAVMWNHAPGMWRQMRRQGIPRLNQEEVAHILAFLYKAGTSDRMGSAQKGRKVFTDKGCVRCHSVGSSGGDRAPELSQIVARAGTIAWMGAMWNHAQSMVGPVTQEMGRWPEFRNSEMNDLIAYVSAGVAAGDDKKTTPGDSERGWRVFQSKCIGCHSIRGQGGAVGPELAFQRELPLSPAGFAGVLWNHAPAMLRQAQDRKVPAPKLEGEEIADLLQFFASLWYTEPTGSPFIGERIFTERGCAACHGSKAEGTRTAPRLKSGADAVTAISLATALWRHGPEMSLQAEKMGIPWAKLEPTDIGDLVSFLNASPNPQ